jgi:hypothetical protein
MQSISKLGLQNLRLNYQKEITYKRIISIVKDIYDDVIYIIILCNIYKYGRKTITKRSCYKSRKSE